MFALVNDDAYELIESTEAEIKPIIQMVLAPAQHTLQEIAKTIAILERTIYPTNFQNGADDFLDDLQEQKDHFVSLVQHNDKKIGYLVAWREKVKLSHLENLLDDDIHLTSEELGALLDQAKPFAKKGCVDVIYLSDTAVLPEFRRTQGAKAPAIAELLGWFAAWATPEPGKTIFVHAEARSFSKNLADKFPHLFPHLKVEPLLSKAYDDIRGETMNTKIWRVTAPNKNSKNEG